MHSPNLPFNPLDKYGELYLDVFRIRYPLSNIYHHSFTHRSSRMTPSYSHQSKTTPFLHNNNLLHNNNTYIGDFLLDDQPRKPKPPSLPDTYTPHKQSQYWAVRDYLSPVSPAVCRSVPVRLLLLLAWLLDCLVFVSLFIGFPGGLGFGGVIDEG